MHMALEIGQDRCCGFSSMVSHELADERHHHNHSERKEQHHDNH